MDFVVAIPRDGPQLSEDTVNPQPTKKSRTTTRPNQKTKIDESVPELLDCPIKCSP